MRYPLIIRSTIHLDNDTEIRMPVIFTVNGILKSYLEYALMKRNKSHSWLDASASAIRLLVEFVEFNGKSTLSSNVVQATLSLLTSTYIVS